MRSHSYMTRALKSQDRRFVRILDRLGYRDPAAEGNEDEEAEAVEEEAEAGEEKKPRREAGKPSRKRRPADKSRYKRRDMRPRK